MFSNHISAIPLEETDRRIEVVISDRKPQNEGHYRKLYSQLHDEQFIASVAKFLMERDISAFNPGATALTTEHKQSATAISKSEADEAIEFFVEYWPYDIVPTTLITEYMPNTPDSVLKHIKTRAGISTYLAPGQTKPTSIRVDVTVNRLAVIKNPDLWIKASLVDVKAEAKKSIELLNSIKKTAGFSANITEAMRAYLDDRAAQ